MCCIKNINFVHSELYLKRRNSLIWLIFYSYSYLSILTSIVLLASIFRVFTGGKQRIKFLLEGIVFHHFKFHRNPFTWVNLDSVLNILRGVLLFHGGTIADILVYWFGPLLRCILLKAASSHYIATEAKWHLIRTPFMANGEKSVNG